MRRQALHRTIAPSELPAELPRFTECVTMSFTPYKKPVRPRTTIAVLDLLERSDALGRLRVGVQQVSALADDLARLLPDYLTPNVDAGAIKDGTLTLLTGHSALAARLRHLEPGLVGQLQQRGWPVQKLRIKVQPRTAAPAPPPPKPPLSTAALTSLRALSAVLGTSPLQDSLQRMIAHHEGAPARRTK
jgi:hypothetical protein